MKTIHPNFSESSREFFEGMKEKQKKKNISSGQVIQDLKPLKKFFMQSCLVRNFTINFEIRKIPLYRQNVCLTVLKATEKIFNKEAVKKKKNKRCKIYLYLA